MTAHQSLSDADVDVLAIEATEPICWCDGEPTCHNTSDEGEYGLCNDCRRLHHGTLPTPPGLLKDATEVADFEPSDGHLHSCPRTDDPCDCHGLLYGLAVQLASKLYAQSVPRPALVQVGWWHESPNVKGQWFHELPHGVGAWVGVHCRPVYVLKEAL